MVVVDMAGAEDTIYLCNFRVSVDGDWLCLKELADGGGNTSKHQGEGMGGGSADGSSPGSPMGELGSAAAATGCSHAHSPNHTHPSFTHDGSHADTNPPVVGSIRCSEGPVGWPGLPRGLFAPYIPLSCERDPVSIERSNLVNISKLVVKELIESSLKFGRMQDSDSVPLQHFFIVLEHVLRHGLKPKRGILGPKKELWDLFQMVEKWTYEAQDITASIRDLPTVKTHIGRARAWLRLALMQKKLADYFRMFIERRDDLLTEFYEPGALMLADEAIVIMGLLVGLNVIDCNLCVKEEDLDSQMGVIDFSLYLRNSAAEMAAQSPEEMHQEQSDMTTVLDQKNYIEELNRHLNATVTNLQAKLETLTTTNALMKEDLAIAKNTSHHLQLENDKIRKEKGMPTQMQQDQLDKEAKKASRISVIGCEEEMQDIKRNLEEENAHRKQVERELELQIQMKAESEMAAKLLEKDIHEKQDTIVSLRRQLDDIKSINLEMYSKLHECESSLKQKTELIDQLESKAAEMGESVHKLESQYQECLIQKTAAKDTLMKLNDKISDGEIHSSAIETDLKIEREWRQSIQETLQRDKEGKAELYMELENLNRIKEEYEALKTSHEMLISTVENQERTLEELGAHLSESKLKMVDLRDASKSLREAQWAPDKEATNCTGCEKEFGISRRRHHCRHCGNIFCSSCSDNTMPLPSSARPVRVCDSCHTKLLQRYSNAEV